MEPTKQEIQKIAAKVEPKVFAFVEELQKYVGDKKARLELIGACNQAIDEAILLAYRAGSQNDNAT